MTHGHADPGGPSGTPDTLGPPDPTDTITLACPTCHGSGVAVYVTNCGPRSQNPCVTCGQSGAINVYWATSRQEHKIERRSHLVQVAGDPAQCLCEHDPIPRKQLAGFFGLPCMGCLHELDRLHVAEARLVSLADEFDGTTHLGPVETPDDPRLTNRDTREGERMPDEFDLSRLSPEERARAEASIQQAVESGHVFTDQDQTPPPGGDAAGGATT